ncbi:MAG: DUF2029 domain-containing protein [Armatimonadetes bacterium]|nr:DUF2029 domain-containing protein [Anaerolineae bacterium]
MTSTGTARFAQPAMLIAAVILALVLVANVLFTYVVFTRPFPGFNDYLTVWEGARAYFYDGLDPYSPATSLRIQTRIYGRAALPDEQPNHFAYPFYAVFFVYPFIHFEYAFATALWVVFLECCLIAAALLAFNLYRWRPRPTTVMAVALLAVFCYPGARGLFLGQVSHLVYLLQALALWATVKDRDRLAGVALALSSFKPQMGILFIPLLLLWALYQRRWRLLSAFGITLALLVGASFVLLPEWVAGFWTQVRLYPAYIEVSTPAWVITQYWLNLGSGAEIAVNLVAYAGVLWTWVALRQHPERFLWTVMLALTVTHVVGPRTASPHFIVFMLPLLFYLHQMTQRRMGWRMLLLMVALVLVPWLHFLLTISPTKFEHPTVFLPLPLLNLAALLMTRTLWWKVHAQQLKLSPTP